MAYNQKIDNKAWVQITDQNGNDIIKIDAEGGLHVDPKFNTNEASVHFWQGVLDFIPTSQLEIVECKLNLIKAYSVINTLEKEGVLDATKIKNEESRDFCLGIIRELKDLWR